MMWSVNYTYENEVISFIGLSECSETHHEFISSSSPSSAEAHFQQLQKKPFLTFSGHLQVAGWLFTGLLPLLQVFTQPILLLVLQAASAVLCSHEIHDQRENNHLNFSLLFRRFLSLLLPTLWLFSFQDQKVLLGFFKYLENKCF